MGWGGGMVWGSEREVQESGDLGISTAASCPFMAETHNTVKQSSSNEK